MSPWSRIILLGDSITQYSFDEHGWGAAVATIAQRKCDVYNRGFSGYTTDYIVKIMNENINQKLLQDVAAVTVFLGANDSSLADLNQRQHVPLEKYELNLSKILDHIHSLGVSFDKVILISPPPVDEKAWLEHLISNKKGDTCDRSNQVTQTYAQACSKIAQFKGCRFIDLWSKMMENPDYSLYLSDGLHFSKEGNYFLAKCLTPHISQLIADLPVILPLWNEFNI